MRLTRADTMFYAVMGQRMHFGLLVHSHMAHLPPLRLPRNDVVDACVALPVERECRRSTLVRATTSNIVAYSTSVQGWPRRMPGVARLSHLDHYLETNKAPG